MSTTTGFLNRYLEGDSLFHQADPRVKLVVTLSFIFAMTSIPPGVWPAFGAMIALVWTAAAFSRIGLVRIFLRSLLAVPFILIALPTVFTKPGVPLFELDMALFALTATREGLMFFVSVLLKSWASVTTAAILTSTTPPLKLLEALKALRLPAILVAVVMLMYRYLFVLVDEAQRLLRARTARSAAIGPRSGGTIVWRARGAGGMAGSLFIRTIDRSERIYFAMLARGYNGRVKAQESEPLGMWPLMQVAIALTIFVAIAAMARVLG
jgi:cobalt/nickel transport system permease protein